MIPQDHDNEVEPTSGFFTPRLANDPAYRLSFELDLEDLDRFDELERDSSESIIVTDQTTGLQWHVRPADCGADCFCDAECWPADAIGKPFGKYANNPDT